MYVWKCDESCIYRDNGAFLLIENCYLLIYSVGLLMFIDDDDDDDDA